MRPARSGDWMAIWPIFQAVVAAGDSYAYPEDLSREAAADLWMQDPPDETVVAVLGDRVVGTAKMGPNRGGRGAHIATASFMVDAEARGLGIGRTLGRYVLEWASEHGYRGMQFNAVVETNTAAVTLWKALGFRIIGTVPGAFQHAEHGYVGLHVMYRDLP